MIKFLAYRVSNIFHWRYVYIYFFKITTVTLTFEICVLEMKISPVQCEIMEFLQVCHYCLL